MAGENYLLGKNNTYVFIVEGNNNTNAWYFMKSITTIATGSCRIKISYVSPDGSAGGNGNIRLYRNKALFGTYTAGITNIDMPLIDEKTTIDLEALILPLPGRPVLGSGMGIANFELWVQDNPGLLAMLVTS